MAYYHMRCGGKISLRSRTCSKCGHKWPISAWFTYPPPPDMTKFLVEKEEKGPMTLPKWADKFPPVRVIAGGLPNIPRWSRILIALVILGVVIFIIILVRGGL